MSALDDLESLRVFISYSHDSPQHKQRVGKLRELLRSELGIEARMDTQQERYRVDFSQWVIHEIDTADFVLAIASPQYRERADGRPGSADGGAQFEGALLRNKLTQDRVTWTRKILPIVLPGATVADIPEFLCGYSTTHFVIDRLTPDGIAELRAVLTGQLPPPVSALRDQPARTAGPPPAQTTISGNVTSVLNSRVRNVHTGNNYHYGNGDGRG